MSWKLWTAAAVVSAQLPVTIMAKPPDLPIDQRINYASEEPAPIAPAADPASPAAIRAVEVFAQAERQQRLGQLSEARRSYQEVHLLSPASRVGQQAIQRLHDLESPGNDFSEEQEPPLFVRPDRDTPRELNYLVPRLRQYLEMLRLTQPLGAVPSGPVEH